MRNFEDRI